MPIPDYKQISESFYKEDPYVSFKTDGLPLKLSGWHSDADFFRKIIKEVQPRFLIEVGTWLGASAIHFSEILSSLELSCPVLCIDTWLGSQEFWLNPEHNERYEDLNIRHGFPSVYYQFLANVVHKGHQNRILPLPQTSQTAARILEKLGYEADLIYIDASHDEGDVLSDLESFWKLLAPGGVIFGDDYDEFWAGLVKDVNTFATQRGLQLEQNGAFWLLRKPQESPACTPVVHEKATREELVIGLQAENAVLRARLITLERQSDALLGERSKRIINLEKNEARLMKRLQYAYARLETLDKPEPNASGEKLQLHNLKEKVTFLERTNQAYLSQIKALKETLSGESDGQYFGE